MKDQQNSNTRTSSSDSEDGIDRSDHTQPRTASYLGALEDLNAAVFDLVNSVRVTQAPETLLRELTNTIATAQQQLQPHHFTGVLAQATLDGEKMAADGEASDIHDPGSIMRYSAFVGKRNPISPRFEFKAVDKTFRGTVVFPPIHTGPPNAVHGGFVAALFDEILGSTNVLHTRGGFTGTLEIKYHRPTPVQQAIDIVSRVDRVDGRKTFASAEFRYKGDITASAKGVFITPKGIPEGMAW